MAVLQKDEIPVIYILSNGRSGSTLLDLLLGTHPEIWTLGEAQVLPWDVRESRLPCGCGFPVVRCEFWEPLIPQIPLDGAGYPIEYFREKHNSGKALRWGILYDILRRRPSSRWMAAIGEYGNANARYFSVVREAAEKHSGRPIRWLVDSSKDLYRLFWLQSSGYFDLRVIQLVKDPRSFVYSMVKRFLPNGRRRSFRMASRWLVENWMFAYFCRQPALAGRSLRVRYEDLAGSPDATLDAIGQWLGVAFESDALKTFRQFRNHAIAGNTMRWQDGGIRLDEQWRLALPQDYARMTWAIAGPLARSYGYKP